MGYNNPRYSSRGSFELLVSDDTGKLTQYILIIFENNLLEIKHTGGALMPAINSYAWINNR